MFQNHAIDLKPIAKDILNSSFDHQTSGLENRVVQHYGEWSTWRPVLSHVIPVNEMMPDSFTALIRQLQKAGIMTIEPNQANVYAYTKGQGVLQHLDSPESYENEVVMISLLGTCTLRFTKDHEVYDVPTRPGTIVVIRDDARYVWKHGIPEDSVTSDVRASLVFRRQKHISTGNALLLWCLASLALFSLTR